MKRLSIALSLVLAGPIFGSQEAGVQLTPKACRPLYTTSAGLTEPGTVELELGAQKLLNKDDSEGRTFPTQFNFGINSWFDLRMGWSGPNRHRDSEGACVSGGGDPVIGGQALFLGEARTGVDLGMAYCHKLPRASVAKGIGSGRHDDTLLLTASKVLGRWGVDLNAGANWIGRCEGEGRVRQAAGSLTVTCALAAGWNVSLDTYALARTELSPLVLSNILAVSRDITPDLCVDVAVEVGHSEGAPRCALNAGLVWRLGRLFRAN